MYAASASASAAETLCHTSHTQRLVQVAEAVQKQKRVDLAEQLLFMDPIAEIGGGLRTHL